MFSQSERFQRSWASLYAAVEDGQISQEALRSVLARQLPQQGVCAFPLDGSCWPRPRGRVLQDLQYVYQAASDVNGGTVTGYPYSLLEWCAEPHSSWSLPLDVRRVVNHQPAQAVGAAQVQALARLRSACPQALDIVPADGKYGNAGFLQQVQGLQVRIVTRLRRDRVLYRPASPMPTPRRGRPRKHGARFTFKGPESWGLPDEVCAFEDAYYGQRWPIEPGARFRKESRGWNLPRFHSAAPGDTWTLLVAVAHWVLFLARPLVEDTPWPWQKPRKRFTPQRVRQSLKPIFALIGSPAGAPISAVKRQVGPKACAERPKNATKLSKRALRQRKLLEMRLVRYRFTP